MTANYPSNRAFTRAATQSDEAVGKIINIGSGLDYSINELVRFFDWEWVNLAPRPGEVKVTIADIHRAKQVLGFKPTMSLPVWIKSQLNKRGL